MRTVAVRVALCAVGCAAIAACAAPGGAVRVTDSSARWDFPEQGVSVLPPTGPRWWAVPGATFSPDHVIVFGKPIGDHPPQTAAEVRSIVVGVFLYTLPRPPLTSDVASAEELKRQVDAGVSEGMLPASQSEERHLLSAEEAVDRTPGAECIRYDETLEDTRVPRFEGSPFVERQRGFRCLHPFRAGVVVDFGWSERHLAGLPSADLDAEVQPFLASVRFSAPR